jgi:hypothetical protein
MTRKLRCRSQSEGSRQSRRLQPVSAKYCLSTIMTIRRCWRRRRGAYHLSQSSTGNPKGVPHSQSDMLFCARQYTGEVLKMTGNDIIFSVSNLFFAYAFSSSLIFPAYCGASGCITDYRPISSYSTLQCTHFLLDDSESYKRPGCADFP